MRLVSRAAIAAAYLFATACDASDAAAPDPLPALDVAAIASPQGKLYVLTGTTGQRSQVVATADITCDTVRTVVTVQDSLTLWSDGRVLRAGALRVTRNGVTTDESRLETRGTWRTYTTTPFDYYDDAPGIVLMLDGRPGEGYEWYLRGMGGGGFATRQALGARCGARAANATNDPPRHEEFFYTPR